MKGSITFRFSEQPDDHNIRISREGELDSTELEAIAASVTEFIRLINLTAAGQIQPTLADPTGIQQFHEHWSN
jgi:hypothetical protein